MRAIKNHNFDVVISPRKNPRSYNLSRRLKRDLIVLFLACFECGSPLKRQSRPADEIALSVRLRCDSGTVVMFARQIVGGTIAQL